jgi:hypothetical protein
MIDQQHPDLEDLDLEPIAHARLLLWEHGRDNGPAAPVSGRRLRLVRVESDGRRSSDYVVRSHRAMCSATMIVGRFVIAAGVAGMTLRPSIPCTEPRGS